MTRKEIKKIAMCYAHDELKDSQSPIEDVVAAAFIDGANYADSHPHWISIEDEMPPLTHKEEEFGFDYSDKVLVLLKETDADGMTITFAEYNRDHPRIIDGDVPKEECYWSAVKSCDMYEGFGDGITHWMPLPEAPKSGCSEIPNNCEKGGNQWNEPQPPTEGIKGNQGKTSPNLSNFSNTGKDLKGD